MNHTRKKKPQRRQTSYSSKLGCFIVTIVLIPIFYGVYLYCQQTTFNISNDNQQVNTSCQISSTKDLEIPISTTQRQEQIIHHTGYTVSYNKKWKIPNWVSYELTRQETRGNEKRTNQFIADPSIEGIAATNIDYSHSGFDKGHMAPAADMKWSNSAMKESFYFSNMCPQHPQLNRRAWKNLEEKIRDWAVADSAIIIICGPIVEKETKTIGKNRVTVPKQFFKVILSPFAKPIRAIGFLFDNTQSTNSLPSYVVSVDSIENLTGMDFFAPLPDEIEKEIEKTSSFKQWPQ